MDERQLLTTVSSVLDRWPSAGLAAGVVRDGSLEWFLGHGVAEVRSRTPITQDTVFRIGSVTKTMTAIAVMQLWEQGLVDLDAPVSDYLRAFELVPAKASFPPVTIRHLLTHTSGIGYWRRWSDGLRPGVGSGDYARRPVDPLATYYRRGLPVAMEPGRKWVYSNHGFAVLGQIVEDVSDEPFARYLREHVFDPLGMEHTDLVRSGRVAAGLATGYVLRARGLKATEDRPMPTAPGGAVYATPRDMAAYVAALLSGGGNEHGAVLKPETVTLMFEPHFQPDPRVPGMGLAFELDDEDGHRVAAKGGTMSGFLADVRLAPDDRVGVFVCSNTGGLDGRGAPEPLATALLRALLDLPARSIRSDVPPRPETWGELCGWYGLDRGGVANAFDRLLFGAGAEVRVEHGHLMLRPLSPLPSMRRGYRLHPDDVDDAYVFRVDFTDWGRGAYRVAFSRADGALRLEGGAMSMEKRPGALNPRRWATGALVAGGGAAVLHRARKRPPHRTGRTR
jgi:CubicO group peptidase (beta-lactamase class C family)